MREESGQNALSSWAPVHLRVGLQGCSLLTEIALPNKGMACGLAQTSGCCRVSVAPFSRSPPGPRWRCVQSPPHQHTKATSPQFTPHLYWSPMASTQPYVASTREARVDTFNLGGSVLSKDTGVSFPRKGAGLGEHEAISVSCEPCRNILNKFHKTDAL